MCATTAARHVDVARMYGHVDAMCVYGLVGAARM